MACWQVDQTVWRFRGIWALVGRLARRGGWKCAMKSMGVLGEVWGVLRKPRTDQFPDPGLKRGSGEWRGKNADTVVSRPATLAGLEK